MGKKAAVLMLGVCLLTGLWGCGGEPVSSLAESSADSSHTESYAAYSSLEYLLEDLARTGDIPPEVWAPNQEKIKEAFGAEYNWGTRYGNELAVTFWRQVDLDEMARLYGLSLERPQSELVLEPDGKLPGRSRWENACRELNFYCGIEPAEEFPGEEPGKELDWTEAEGYPGYETAAVLHTNTGEPVQVRVRWKADGRLFWAELPGDCLETFWENRDSLMMTMQTGAGSASADCGTEEPVRSQEN